MVGKYTIEEICELEVKKICKEEKFSILAPAVCSACGSNGRFGRRLFRIKGVPKGKQCDDAIQRLFESNFKSNYSIDHIFFKIHGDEFIVDSAICGSCSSTAITYDIEITADLMNKMTEFIGS